MKTRILCLFETPGIDYLVKQIHVTEDRNDRLFGTHKYVLRTK